MKVHADLHIHTVLSPCGDLDMSPVHIIRTAGEKGLHVIGITDHNSTRQATVIRDHGREQGILVLTGAEVTTQEEVHCLTFFPDDTTLSQFQEYLDEHLPAIPNSPAKFGYQVAVDLLEQIIYEEEKLLISALDCSIEEVEKKVHSLQGIFIPAHIDKPRFSVLSQLGFIPEDVHYDALEISRHIRYTDFIRQHPQLQAAAFIQSSDAHYLQEIGQVYTLLDMDDFTFDAFRESLRKLKS